MRTEVPIPYFWTDCPSWLVLRGFSRKRPLCSAQVAKVNLKSNGDEALSDEFLLKSNGDEALSDEFLLKSNGDEALNNVFP